MPKDVKSSKKQGRLFDFVRASKGNGPEDARIRELEELIRYHNDLYYAKGTTEITDEEYDRLRDELEGLDPENPLLGEVGAAPREEAGKIEHPVELLSLDKTHSYEDVVKWAKDVDDFVVQPKLDGLAVSIYYEKGHYRYAATRGDGRIGEDITENVRYIGDVPERLRADATCHIRGEIFMRRSVFEAFAGEFSNPRNAAAGSVKQKDPRVTGERKLNFYAYSLVMEPEELVRIEEMLTGNFQGFDGIRDRERGLMEMLRLLGAEPAEVVRSDLASLPEVFERWDRGRAYDIEFEIDGIVIKVNDLSLQQEMGATHHHPRWAVAWKFTAQQASTRVSGIRWQVSRTGNLTPVAELETVNLAGANISRSTLHNADEILRLGVNVGDEVLIERRGDVIPKVIRVLKKGSREGPAEIPGICPRCGAEVEKENVFLRCTNANCSRRILKQLVHFADVTDLETVGPSLIEKLYHKGLLSIPADFYRLQVEDLLPIEKVGDVLVAKIIRNIRRRRRLPLARFLTALGINHLGEVMATAISRRFRTLDSIRNATREELVDVDGVGGKIADAVLGELEEKWSLVEEMRALGVVIEEVEGTGEEPGEEESGLPLAGNTFCITGTLERPRKFYEDIIRENGGTVKGISRSLDYLVAGEKAGSKLEKAKNWGVKVIDEDALMRMAGRTEEGQGE